MGCDPNPPGKKSDGGYADCTAGNYCPEGTHTPIKCPPGTKRTGVGAKDEADCAACGTGGKWCPRGSTADTNCAAGHYCPQEQTIFAKEWGCPSGKWAAAGAADAVGSCANCGVNEWCREGSDTKTTY